MNNKLVIFGGTGGLGKLVYPLLEENFEVISLGSAHLQIEKEESVQEFFEEQKYIPHIIYMSVRNYDSVLHKLDRTEVIPQIEINITGFLNVLKYALPAMRANSYGRIIYLSSILSEKPIPGTGIYSATKAFNDNIVKTCALENAKYNITCNSINLGYFNAGLTAKVPQNVLVKVMEKIPARRLGNGEDLNTAIRFIFDSPYLNGVNLPLSGGLNLA